MAPGLRVVEVSALKVSDIDSKRMLLRIERGKGGRYRNAMLPDGLLLLLRDWWRAGRQQGIRTPRLPAPDSRARRKGHLERARRLLNVAPPPADEPTDDADGRLNSATWKDAQNLPLQRADGFWVWDARVEMMSNQGWSVALWAKNLTDERYVVHSTSLISLGFGSRIYGAPRTYGLTLSKRF